MAFIDHDISNIFDMNRYSERWYVNDASTKINVVLFSK